MVLKEGGVPGPLGVLELIESKEPNAPLQVCDSESVKMEASGPRNPLVHAQSYRGRWSNLWPKLCVLKNDKV